MPFVLLFGAVLGLVLGLSLDLGLACADGRWFRILETDSVTER